MQKRHTIRMCDMSTQPDSANLDLGRKLNLIEAMLNADGVAPLAQRLGDCVSFSRGSAEQGYVTIEGNDLWLSFADRKSTRVRVTDHHVSDIIALIESPQ
jgi:hypothetical protein